MVRSVGFYPINQIIYGVAFFDGKKLVAMKNRPIKTVFCDVFSRMFGFDVQLGTSYLPLPTEKYIHYIATQ